MGRIWESLVKSVKRSLKVIFGDKLFIEECLSTFLCKVESILIQRPWTPINDNVNFLKALGMNKWNKEYLTSLNLRKRGTKKKSKI